MTVEKKFCNIGCRWYPIERSEYPLYCYLFRQCGAQDEEPEVSLILGGRHPGHYFLAKEEHNDVVMRWGMGYELECLSLANLSSLV
jgi:hypothetical protein